jgi:outer membrane protein TolC
MPALDLNGRIGSSGRADDASDALQGMAHRDGRQWAVDLTLSMPWGLRRESATLRQSAYRLMQSDLQIAEAQMRLIFDVRASCRSVDTGLERIAVTRLAGDMQELRMNQAKAQYQAGLATIRDVMDAQDDVNAARLRVLEATRGTIQAAVRLARLEGSLLDAHGIAWRDDPPPAPGNAE